MKKLTVLMAAIFLLAGCGSGSSASSTTGSGETAKDDKGDYASATITLKGDAVESISLDETKDGKSKKELGADYAMKSKSKIGKEWDEQVKSLEAYIVKNGLDSVKLDESGYPTNNDVLTGCTINVKGMMDAAALAKDNAK